MTAVLRDVSSTSDNYQRDAQGRILARLERLDSGRWLAAPVTVDGDPPRHLQTDRWFTVAWTLLEDRIGPIAPADATTRTKLGDFIRC